MKGLSVRPSIDDVINKIKTVLCERDELTRNVSIYCCQKYSGAKLKEIGERFGISDAAVSQASRRLVIKAKKDQELMKVIDSVEEFLRGVRS